MYRRGDLFDIAAAYLFHIGRNQAFYEGNKRTALHAALTFLDLNGVRIVRPSQLLEDTTVAVANDLLSKEAAASVLRTIAEEERAGASEGMS